jgi:hypothetical protein
LPVHKQLLENNLQTMRIGFSVLWTPDLTVTTAGNRCFYSPSTESKD